MKKSLGYQLTVDFYNCDSNIIDDVATITEILKKGAKMMNLSIVDTLIHKFSPIGISGVVVIKESHIAIHTWPEYAYVSLDFFTCNQSYDLDEGIAWIKEKLGANKMEKSASQRGFLSEIQKSKN